MVKFYTESGTKPLPYDPWSDHPIVVTDIQAAAKAQGVEFRQGDILLLRVGFMQVRWVLVSVFPTSHSCNVFIPMSQRFKSSPQGERDSLRGKPETL